MKGRALLKICSILIIPVCVFGIMIGLLGVRSIREDRDAAQRQRETAVQTLMNGTQAVSEDALDETGGAEISAGLASRALQYALLMAACALATAAAMLGVDAAYDPGRGKIQAGCVLSLAALVLSVAGNICGVVSAYADFPLQMLGLISVSVTSYFLALGFFIYRSAYSAYVSVRNAALTVEAAPV